MTAVSNPIIKSFAEMVHKTTKHMDIVYIVSSAAGWLLSTYAHLKAIKSNDSYSDDQKKFLLKQEKADAAVNIFTFLFLTFGIRGGVEKLISQGKCFLPKSTKNFLAQAGLATRLGKGESVETLLEKAIAPATEIENRVTDFKRYKGNVRTLAALGAGVIASNIITPFVRNEVAAYLQNKNIDKNKTNPKTTVRPLVINKPATTTNIPNPIYNVTGKVYERPISNNNGGMRI